MSLRKVSRGERFRMSADAFNAFVDAASAFQANGQSIGADGTNVQRQTGIVPVRNDSGANQDRFAILGLDVPLITPTDNLQAFQERLAFSAVLPDAVQHERRFCILQEPIAAGALGRAMIVGVSPVRLTIQAIDDIAASIVSGDTARLATGADGAARILWKETGFGPQWGIVQFPTGGSGGSEPNLVLQVTQVAHGWIIADVLQWDGGAWVLADATQVAATDTLAVVGRIIDDDTALMVLWGICCLDGLSPHTDYWLDPLVPGTLTPTKPSESPRLVLHHAENRLCVVHPGGGASGSASRFADLTDVDVITAPPTNGQAALWNNASQLWKPGNVIPATPVAPHQVLIGPIAAPNAVPNFRPLELGDLPEVAATSVIGNATGNLARPGAVTATTDNRVLMRAAGTLQWLTIPTAVIGDGQVTDAKITSVNWGKITGTPASFPPAPHDHILGGDLTGTLSAANIAPAAVGAPEIADGAVTLAKMAAIVGPSVLGRVAGTGPVVAIFSVADGVVLRQQAGVLSFGTLRDDSIAPDAAIGWAKIDKATALPSDIGAAAQIHPHVLSALTDVQIVAPIIGQVLTWNSATTKWQNDDPSNGPIMAARSVWANPTAAPAIGINVVAGADNQVLMRMSGTLQFVAMPAASLGNRQLCSVVGRSPSTDGPAADIQALANDSILTRVADSLQWLGTVPRLKLGGEATGKIQMVGSTGLVTHEYESLNTVHAWKQFNNGKTRFYFNPTDYWEIAANGSLIELTGKIGGVATHRISLSAALITLGGVARTLSLREIDICENGIAKKMAVLASAPY